MAASDTIIVEIDDTDLEAYLMRLELLDQMSYNVTGSREPLKETLPGIDRNMRVILGRIPGMREAIQMYFRVRYLERGIEKIPTEGFTFLGLTLLATAIILFQRAMQFKEDIERDRENYERLVRESLDISYKEYMDMDVKVKGLASEWDEFQYNIKTFGITKAIGIEIGIWLERFFHLPAGTRTPQGVYNFGESDVQ